MDCQFYLETVVHYQSIAKHGLSFQGVDDIVKALKNEGKLQNL